jgi:hypothetical protein
MKFCKNLQRVVDISDPEWAPYWTNYKALKKLIKELPSLGHVEEKPSTEPEVDQAKAPLAAEEVDSSQEDSSPAKSALSSLQEHGDQTTESEDVLKDIGGAQNQKDELGKNPGEIAFFKLLHAEFKKVTHFFERAQEEFTIREERVREGMELMKMPNSIMVNEKWSMVAKSIYRLYKDLLLLETFAIMTYCSFSKILKKHDKVTGHQTRAAFMSNVVNKSNFASYPKVLSMISHCEQMYEDVSSRLMQEGKEGLYEDERLFINMISRLNEQALETDDAPEQGRRPKQQSKVPVANPSSQPETRTISTLRLLVEESEARNFSVASTRNGSEDRKRSSTETNSRSLPSAKLLKQDT